VLQLGLQLEILLRQQQLVRQVARLLVPVLVPLVLVLELLRVQQLEQ
jgi:hypothetical protein